MNPYALWAERGLDLGYEGLGLHVTRKLDWSWWWWMTTTTFLMIMEYVKIMLIACSLVGLSSVCVGSVCPFVCVQLFYAHFSVVSLAHSA